MPVFLIPPLGTQSLTDLLGRTSALALFWERGEMLLVELIETLHMCKCPLSLLVCLCKQHHCRLREKVNTGRWTTMHTTTGHSKAGTKHRKASRWHRGYCNKRVVLLRRAIILVWLSLLLEVMKLEWYQYTIHLIWDYVAANSIPQET